MYDIDNIASNVYTDRYIRAKSPTIIMWMACGTVRHGESSPPTGWPAKCEADYEIITSPSQRSFWKNNMLYICSCTITLLASVDLDIYVWISLVSV